jgi:hypothetical protein
LTECKQKIRRDCGDKVLAKMLKKFIGHAMVELVFYGVYVGSLENCMILRA